MIELAEKALETVNILAQKSRKRTLTEYEAQLYEAASRLATTVLNFHDVCSQSAMIRAERELVDATAKPPTRQKGRTG